MVVLCQQSCDNHAARIWHMRIRRTVPYAIFLSDGHFSDLVSGAPQSLPLVVLRMRKTSCDCSYHAAGAHLAGVSDGVQKASQKVYSVLENNVASSPVGHTQA